MRIFISIPLFLVLAVWGCGGDSSSLISTSGNDGGVAPATGGVTGGVTGGQGGQTVVPSGGSISGGTIVVPGGIRDMATTFCTTTTGDSCEVSADKITCGKTYCSENLIECYNSDGTGGKCKKYASCRLACSCDAKERAKCENKCMADDGMTNSDCSACLTNLYICSAQYGCTPPTNCP